MMAAAGRWLLATAVIGMSEPAAAFDDPATGLRVIPPAPFEVQRLEGDPRVNLKVMITSRTGKPASFDEDGGICIINFRFRSSPKPTTQAELRAMVADPRWQEIARQAMATAIDIDRTTLFTQQGYRGIEMQGPAAHSKAARAFISLIDTVKGRTTMSCAVRATDFAGALPQFRALRAAIALPN